MADVVVGEDSVFGNGPTDGQPSVDGLIARLKEATGTDYDIDAAIAALCHPTDDPRFAAFENGRDYPDRYTSCIDAALTLVPEDRDWLVRSEPNSGGRAFANVYRAPAYLDERPCQAYAATAPLALCIAALTARKAAVPQTVAGTDATTSNTES